MIGALAHPALYRAAGDLSDTGKEYIQDLAFRDIEIHDLNAPVKFSFVMANSGHGDDSKIRDAMTQGAIDYFSHVDMDGRPDLWEDETPIEQVGYFTELISDRAVEFVSRRRSALCTPATTGSSTGSAYGAR